MVDLTIEHDPDSGCGKCPLRPSGTSLSCRARVSAHVHDINKGKRGVADRFYRANEGAPITCPLRTARVVVHRPGGES